VSPFSALPRTSACDHRADGRKRRRTFVRGGMVRHRVLALGVDRRMTLGCPGCVALVLSFATTVSESEYRFSACAVRCTFVTRSREVLTWQPEP
jgi:hypothetical protein